MMNLTLAAVPWSGMKNAYPPLGLGYLAAAVRSAPGIRANIRILDFALYPRLTIEQTVERIMEGERPHILGLSCLTNNYHKSLELAARAKQVHPDLKTVFGGPHISVDPEAAAAHPAVDAAVYGEGEVTFLELLNRAGEGAWAEGVSGLAYCGPKGVVKNPPRPLIEDLDSLPFPARDLMAIETYNLKADDGHHVYTVLSSRGCPYGCTYCFKGTFGHRFRARSAHNVLAEIRELVQTYGARHIYFGDDIFMIEPDRVRSICEGLLEDGQPVRWSCLARVDAVTPDLLALMRAAGCTQIHYGIESACDEILSRIRKQIDLEAVTRAVRFTREAGIRSKGYFMAGLPGDTEETLERTLHFAKTLPLDEVMFSLATPFPGTVLWEEMLKKGIEPGEEDYVNAFYFDDGAGAVKVFFNLSEVETGKLETFVRRAQTYFSARKEQGRFRRRFGPLLGPIAYFAYRIRGGT